MSKSTIVTTTSRYVGNYVMDSSSNKFLEDFLVLQGKYICQEGPGRNQG